ncbi:flagellar basal body L-ring protein FlgH [Microvirga massiliensis]|uniref:flagellar basal body L-ring protein FlgH n=1 Tax=Microvirga massiliensis TaxID=1033741 RepID=UPI00062BBC68|nr:flagellar basal body L-ring protein FlgH [Microvirga massiliensis]
MNPRITFALALSLGAVQAHAGEFLQEPGMTPVGTGLRVHRQPVPSLFQGAPRSSRGSTWSNASADLYQGARAKRVGDIVTVNIQIDDKAEMENASDRERNSKVKKGFDFGLSFLKWGADGSADGGINSGSSAKGRGTIDRSEKLRLQVAAIVTEVLPNGNVILSGSQEVRVNYELRVLNIAGIARPRDISPKNTISYDKIAEARVSYGGRGRINDVQQPAYGQQILDVVSPF